MGSRAGRFIEYEGRVQIIAQWSKEFGVPESRIRWRLKNGWSVKQSLTTPVRYMPKRLPQSIRKQKNAMRLKRKNKKRQGK